MAPLTDLTLIRFALRASGSPTLSLQQDTNAGKRFMLDLDPLSFRSELDRVS